MQTIIETLIICRAYIWGYCKFLQLVTWLIGVDWVRGLHYVKRKFVYGASIFYGRCFFNGKLFGVLKPIRF